MTAKEVEEIRKLLIKAQETLEEAGRKVCSVPGEHANRTWNRITSHANEISDTIFDLWRLVDD